MQLTGRSLAALRELLSGDDISLNELENLVFDLFMDAEGQLDLQNKDSLVRTLLKYANARSHIDRLLRWLLRKRPELIDELETKEPKQNWRPAPAAESEETASVSTSAPTAVSSPPPIAVPVAVLAMTATQATQVQQALDDPPTYVLNHEFRLNDLRALEALFANGDQTNLLDRYDPATPEAWQPYIAANPVGQWRQTGPIKTEVEYVVRRFNAERNAEVPLTLAWLSDDFVSDNPARQSQAFSGMRGGILIVDTVSLVHPQIRQTFHSFNGRVERHTCFILGISPLSPAAYTVFTRLGELEYRLLDNQLYEAIEAIQDSCAYGLNRQHIVQRWLKSALRRQSTLPTRPDPTARSNARQLYNNQPTGYTPSAQVQL